MREKGGGSVVEREGFQGFVSCGTNAVLSAATFEHYYSENETDKRAPASTSDFPGGVVCLCLVRSAKPPAPRPPGRLLVEAAPGRTAGPTDGPRRKAGGRLDKQEMNHLPSTLSVGQMSESRQRSGCTSLSCAN